MIILENIDKNNVNLEIDTEIKYMSFILDDKLNFYFRADFITKKMNKKYC